MFVLELLFPVMLSVFSIGEKKAGEESFATLNVQSRGNVRVSG